MNLRQSYLEFFAKKGHKIYSSIPLVPDDSSLLFTNAGMVGFKDIFTGKIPIPIPPRATSAQLCMRAGGKHNDLENVGYTARHHTLFEMLGNFSFGDYFKREAIAFSWEFVTEILGFDKNVLYVTIHESDDEAYRFWCEHVEPSRIKRMGDKDNFWQMGDSGPCGPCSEIYVDQGEKYFHSSEDYLGGDGDRFLEIWNLVFMQYEQKDGVRTPLPKPSIDTGMGLERVIALLEGKLNNFDTSLFAPLMQVIEKLTNLNYYHDDMLLNNTVALTPSSLDETKKRIASFRVIADHARAVTFLLAQGVNFDKEGRGYVLRRILRRAIRHGYLLGLREAFVYEVVNAVCESMGQHYTYLLERKDFIKEQCKTEEVRFLETIESGMELFNAELQKTQKIFSGEVAFRLYDTFGFPLDLTQDMLKERNLTLDTQTFNLHMDAQKSRSKASWKGSGDDSKQGDFKWLLNKYSGLENFVGYEHTESEVEVLEILDSHFKPLDSLQAHELGYVLLDKTPFYPQSGGAIGDQGELHKGKLHQLKDSKPLAQIKDTQKYFGLNLSRIELLQGNLKVGDKLSALVWKERQEIAKHHSATHLLHFALRKILGEHITQAGSLVEPNRLRFDFSHPKPLSEQELENIQELVNRQICANLPQICESMSITQAKSKGAMALFGEKYGEVVRVVSFGDSVELCGGIHVEHSAEIGSFYITKESGVSSGVRRIEAVCGKAAYLYGKSALDTIRLAKQSLKSQDLLQGIQKLKTQIEQIKSHTNKSKASVKTLGFQEIQGIKLIIAKLEDTSNAQAKSMIDEAKNQNQKVAILLIAQSQDKISLSAGVRGIESLKANIWIKEVAQILGGSGGGRGDFATAGGKDITKIDSALKLAREIALDAFSTKTL
ncbi:alanine--tRNA ligase [Helicobacter sp. 10-6591]|uniref:alanine--tRNA ligase n=1 Tax=Helicobacter sp. 10-6591 TaxID=2004998 RepID=UPI000DCCAADB|nr:alanine--tRNA ligase [Helicobacter sp. 10-6591]RAX56016.1 alanine--tRNA ligase [Helicobacter sp. 10-6591]